MKSPSGKKSEKAIMESCLRLLGQGKIRWQDFGTARWAKAIGCKREDLQRACPDKKSLADYVLSDAARKAAKTEWQPENPVRREQIFEWVWAVLQQLSPHRKALRAAWADPSFKAGWGCALLRQTPLWVEYLNYPHLSIERHVLFLFLTALMFWIMHPWLNDDDKSQEKSMAAMDRVLFRVDQFCHNLAAKPR